MGYCVHKSGGPESGEGQWQGSWAVEVKQVGVTMARSWEKSGVLSWVDMRQVEDREAAVEPRLSEFGDDKFCG